MSKSYIKLTLASNKKQIIIAKDSIAFAMEEEGENDKHVKEEFTRVFLDKTINEISYIDVQEKPYEILKN